MRTQASRAGMKPCLQPAGGSTWQLAFGSLYHRKARAQLFVLPVGGPHEAASSTSISWAACWGAHPRSLTGATTPTSPPVHAAMWATSVGAAGTTLLACKANFLPAGLAASNLILYAFVYTPLKQIHPVNTWVGAVVGAIPPLLGWAAAASELSLNSMILPAALYFWQLPHFMALAYLCRDDYVAGGY